MQWLTRTSATVSSRARGTDKDLHGAAHRGGGRRSRRARAVRRTLDLARRPGAAGVGGRLQDADPGLRRLLRPEGRCPGTVTARRRMTCRYRRRPMPGGLQRRPRRMRPMVDGRLQHIPVHGRDPAGAGRWHAGVQHLRLRRGPPHDGIRPQGCSCLRRQWIGRRARDLHPASVVSGQSARCSCPLGGREPGCRAGGQPPITVRMPGGGPGRGSSRRARDRARGCAG